jgi:hypothetical protein
MKRLRSAGCSLRVLKRKNSTRLSIRPTAVRVTHKSWLPVTDGPFAETKEQLGAMGNPPDCRRG